MIDVVGGGDVDVCGGEEGGSIDGGATAAVGQVTVVDCGSVVVGVVLVVLWWWLWPWKC